jgi:hypothetical protein
LYLFDLLHPAGDTPAKAPIRAAVPDGWRQPAGGNVRYFHLAETGRSIAENREMAILGDVNTIWKYTVLNVPGRKLYVVV